MPASTVAACYGLIDTRFGTVAAWLNAAGALLRLEFNVERELERAHLKGTLRDDAALGEVARQLQEYQAGTRREFTLALAPDGSTFQHQVWAELCRIPYGSTISYGELARRVGDPGAARAVGRANATNPIALIVPCHRVIGSDGKLTGYAGGLPLKAALLQFEMSHTPPALFL
ncbi:methylated-DNA--[protein]-cysteine S-methyltransferase [Vogesella sp. LIG4]|uniref:methylated-DNA--[protein]-cysteine S-methyltransferase n=1 Tax=Vogesella sp. LIG4 TaxID=1192162 RepID=UPI00081FD507|nr:methylated-DNA--[protein]-cysteine S-methyltransferase [Vogesella sp. LIG4]SCK21500.1 methylated-DNA-[protein]-cysteine S-methyltransferase [Vogesella sp. LIG4]